LRVVEKRCSPDCWEYRGKSKRGGTTNLEIRRTMTSPNSIRFKRTHCFVGNRSPICNVIGSMDTKTQEVPSQHDLFRKLKCTKHPCRRSAGWGGKNRKRIASGGLQQLGPGGAFLFQRRSHTAGREARWGAGWPLGARGWGDRGGRNKKDRRDHLKPKNNSVPWDTQGDCLGQLGVHHGPLWVAVAGKRGEEHRKHHTPYPHTGQHNTGPRKGGQTTPYECKTKRKNI